MQGQFDREDTVLAGVFVVASAVMVGFATVEAFGIALSDIAFSTAGFDFSWALLLSVGVLGVVAATNDMDLDKLDTEYYVAAVATPVLTVLISVVPEFRDLITGNDFIAAGAMVVMGTGYAAMSYFA